MATMNGADGLPKYVTLAQAAESLSITTRTLRRYISEGLIPGYRIGPRGGPNWKPGQPVRVRVDDVEKLIWRMNTVNGDDE